MWSAPASGPSPAVTNAGPSAELTSSVAAGTDRVFSVTKPALASPASLDYYFFFDSPGAGGSAAMSTQPAVSKVASTWSPGAQDPVAAYGEHFQNLAAGTTITILGDASFEGDPNQLGYNTSLAWRRATAVQASIASHFAAKHFTFAIQPALADPQAPTTAEQNAWAAAVGWTSHAAPNDRTHWRATVSFTPNTPAGSGTVTVHRDAAETPKPPAPPKDPPVPEVSPPPSWFRSAKVTVRVVDSQLIALQLDLEVDINTMTEEKLQGQMASAPAGTQLPRGRTLNHGTPVGPNNPADGIMAMRALVQTDPSTGRWTTLLTVGADPADTDGLVHFGWIPQVDPMPASKDLGVTFLGSYLSFWPMLAAGAPRSTLCATSPRGARGVWSTRSLAGAALLVPGVVAALPWFAVERVILFGAEYLHSQLGDGFTATLLADVEIDWSIDLLGLVKIKREQPLKIRYKAIGLSLTNRDGDDDGATPGARWDFRPVFDSTRGYTIDVASGGGLHIADPLGQILRVLGARMSRSNPMTLEVDIALGVDLGVVSIDQASVRAYLDDPSRLPELTALAARIDIPGVIAGVGLHADRQRGRRERQHDRHDRRPARPDHPPGERSGVCRRRGRHDHRSRHRPPDDRRLRRAQRRAPGRHPARQHGPRHLRLPRDLRHALRAQRRDRRGHRRTGAGLAEAGRRPAPPAARPRPVRPRQRPDPVEAEDRPLGVRRRHPHRNDGGRRTSSTSTARSCSSCPGRAC